MAQLRKGGLVRSDGKPIHGSCAIYFPGGIKIQRHPVPLFIIAEGRDEIVGYLVQGGPLLDI